VNPITFNGIKYSKEDIESIVRSILNEKELIKKELIKKESACEVICTVPAAISNRHIHLSKKDADILFGPGHKFCTLKNLSQPGQYACKETVTLIGLKGIIEKVRVLGPVRPETQVEISMTDSFKLGVNALVRDSGDITGTPGINIAGPYGTVRIDKGVIVARRHLHMHTDEARACMLKDRELVDVYAAGARPLVFRDVLVRVSDRFSTELHVDTDEGNCGAIKNGDTCCVIKMNIF
jgi:putative phosphotransacetylase